MSTAHARYNTHIKECLTSGKQVELSMKDFLPTKSKTTTKKTTKPPLKIIKTPEQTLSIILESIKTHDEYIKYHELKGNIEDAKREYHDKVILEILLSKLTGTENEWSYKPYKQH